MSHGTVRLFDEDPLAGTRTLFVPTDDKGSFQLVTQQDHEPIMQDARDERNMHNSKAWHKWKGDMHKVATIPLPVLMELYRIGIAHDQKEFAKWLDDPDNAVFRTKPGSLSR